MRRDWTAVACKVLSGAILLSLVTSAPGCAGADPGDEAGLDDEEATSVHENALEDGNLQDDPGLCDRLLTGRSKLGKSVEVYGHRYHVIVGSGGADKLVGTPGPDVILGLGGADKIWARGGTDIVCAGAGADFVDGGLGQDRIYGEGGNDVLHGGNAGDWIHGGQGNDEIYGDLLDDKLYGDEDDDLIVGAHGVDHMEGGPGNDWLRGDTNGDTFIGGTGHDTASFMTARPTGRSGKNGKLVMDIDLAKGRAVGDGDDELLKGIDEVIGSAFDDAFHGGAGKFSDGLGNDTCNGAPCGDPSPAERPLIFVDARPRDTGIVFLGRTDADKVVFTRKDNGTVVATSESPIHPGAHCTTKSVHVVECDPPGQLRWLMAWGDDGNDELAMTNGFPRDFNAHLDGGEGDDDLIGADGQDILFSGREGKDTLDGGPNDDALISESYSEDRNKPGHEYGGGEDTLLGRGGNDQLVSDYPCGNHNYFGGLGIDIAGFARVGDRPIHAQLGGPVGDGEHSDFYGKAFLPGVCNAQKYGTTLADDLEILEGSKGKDKLLGNNRDNIIWGRQGDDILKGNGGDDVLLGQEGNDNVD
jgi:Ca2+-binding RTX toxin-like protein